MDMPEEFDFSELRKYLQGQMDMGEEDLLLDEPWTLTRKKSAAPAGVRPANPMPQMNLRATQRLFCKFTIITSKDRLKTLWQHCIKCCHLYFGKIVANLAYNSPNTGTPLILQA